MSIFRSPAFLRRVLLVDAAACALMGAVLAAASGTIAGWTALPHSLLLVAGVALLPIAGFIGFVATRDQISEPAVWLIVVGNGAWVVASIWLLVGAGLSPNALGHVLVGGQALAVGVLAELEFFGVRNLSAATA